VVFLSTDVFLFYVVFEATLIPAYFLIGGFGRGKRSAAALKFLMFQLGGGLVLLGSVIGLYVVSADAGSPSYLIDDLQQLTSRRAPAGGSSPVLHRVRGQGALFPVHTWLAHLPSRPRRRPACCWSACSTRSAPLGCCGSASACSGSV
jgi:NADH-quinone oxidoreductase subunit M